jgi:uncharacterized protein YdcH (DUF465 family)
MEQRDEELIESLLPQNAELKQAWDEHRRLSDAVERLTDRGHLTAAEEMEKKNLQKLKLAEKDKIQRILDLHRRGGQADSTV